MERGEKGGVVLDGDSSPDDGSQGEIDAALKTIEKDNDVIDQPAGDEDPERGREVPQDGEMDGEEENQPLEGSEGAGEEKPDRIATVEKIVGEIKNKLEAKPEEPAKPLTDEDWKNLEEQWGAPRSTIERVTQQSVKVHDSLRQYIDGKFAKLEVGSAIDSVAEDPKFSDARRYKKEIQEFLNDYDTKHWSNPLLIQKATIYARGLRANANVNRARNEGERNRKIAGPARPSSPGSSAKRSAPVVLNGAHRQAAELMGGEKEYARFRSRPSRTIE